MDRPRGPPHRPARERERSDRLRSHRYTWGGWDRVAPPGNSWLMGAQSGRESAMPHKDPEKRRTYAREYSRARRAVDPAYREMHLRAGAKFRAKQTREAVSAENRRQGLRKYGLTVETFREMFEQQEGLCGICSVLMCMCAKGHTVCRRRAVVDHDHNKTGRASVRGLVCSTCNMGMGSLQDSPRLLRNAAAYIEAS